MAEFGVSVAIVRTLSPVFWGRLICGAALLQLTAAAAHAAPARTYGEEVIELGPRYAREVFTAPPSEDAPTPLPEGWERFEIDEMATPTLYRPFETPEKRRVVRADSRASASGLIRRVEIDPRAYPVMRWWWRVENVLEKGDARRRARDDFSARIYIAFRYEPEQVGIWRRARYLALRGFLGDRPIGALNYVWANRVRAETLLDSPVMGGFSKLIAVQSGDENVGEWVREERDVYSDYIAAYGEAPTAIEGVAIMTDTDDTGESAVAFYGEIQFLERR